MGSPKAVFAKVNTKQALFAWTKYPFTKNFNHLGKLRPGVVKREKLADPARDAPVAAKDRIKQWNVVPGDRVRVRGHPIKDILRVAEINKLTNRVRLKRIVEDEGDYENEEERMQKQAQEDSGNDDEKEINVHYSRLQLFWRNMKLPGRDEETPVFITRMRHSKAVWRPQKHSFYWDRFALQTSPRVPRSLTSKPIPWPMEEIKKLRERQNKGYVAKDYITTADAVKEVTYEPPDATQLLHMKSPSRVKQYLRALYNPQPELRHNVWGPMEVHVTRELSNPHSRAKRQARWKARHEYQRVLLSRLMTDELAAAAKEGRSRREARVDAVYKWKAQLAREAREERQRRKIVRGDQAREDKKRAKRQHKAARKIEMLRRVVIQEGPNQVLPGKPQQVQQVAA